MRVRRDRMSATFTKPVIAFLQAVTKCDALVEYEALSLPQTFMTRHGLQIF